MNLKGSARAAIACAIVLFGGSLLSNAQVITGRVQSAKTPVEGATVRLTYYDSTACKQLGELTRPATASEQRELDYCRRELTEIRTDKNGSYEFNGLRPGWYSIRFGWRVPSRPEGDGLPLWRQDGYLLMFSESRTEPREYSISAIASDIFELTAEARVEKSFTYRPRE
jgi:hypothetical protein